MLYIYIYSIRQLNLRLAQNANQIHSQLDYQNAIITTWALGMIHK